MEIDYKELYLLEKKKNEELYSKYVYIQSQISKEDSPYVLLKNIIINQYNYQDKNNIWNNSDFYLINALKNDYSGSVGELFIKYTCEYGNIDYNYEENKIDKSGVYDIKIKNKNIEIKTARYGNSKSFQHEGLRNEGCDYYLFLDIKTDCLYMTILPKFNLKQKCNITGRKPRLRKGTDNVYKFDLNEKCIEKYIDKNLSIKIDKNTTLEDVCEFINVVIN